LYASLQAGKVTLNYTPDDIDIDPEILMHNHVSKSRPRPILPKDVRPGRAWIVRGKPLR